MRGFCLGIGVVLSLSGFVLFVVAQAPAPTDVTYLLRGTQGDLPSETGTEATKVTKTKSQVLGSAGLAIELVDTFGQKNAAVQDWSGFRALRFDLVNSGSANADVELNVFHSGTRNFATRVVTQIQLKPGLNKLAIPITELKNSNGSAANLNEVRRWYIANPGKPVQLVLGDVFFEGKGPTSKTPKPAYVIKTDPARLERLRTTPLPKFEKPILYNTPEADKIMAAVEVFPPDNPWNTIITDWPLHLNSQKLVASVGANKPLRYNPDMCYVIVPGDQKKIDVKLQAYAGESDPGPFPVPDNTPIEGWPASFVRDAKLKALTLDDVQRGKPTLDADRHGIVIDPIQRKLYEFYRLTKTEKGWVAEQSSVFDLASNKLRPDTWTSSDAAGLPILPSIVRHDELQRGSIDHALRFTVTKTRRAYVYPATHYASRLTDENLPRMGERFRLRKDFDTSGFSKEVRIILDALKKYGMFVADNGMDWGMSVSADDRIPNMHEELRKVKGSDFEVVTPPAGYVPPR